MLYKFRSPVSGDVIMLGPHGDWMLRLLGREPSPRGIIEPADMPQALQALHRAVDQDDQTRAVTVSSETQDPLQGIEEISARQRLWPMMDMLHRSLQAREPVVWGV